MSGSMVYERPFAGMQTARAGVTPASIPVDGPVTSPADGPVSSSAPGALPPQVGCCIGASANPTMPRRCWPGSGATSGVRPGVTSGDRSSDFSGARRAYRRACLVPSPDGFPQIPLAAHVVSPQVINIGGREAACCVTNSSNPRASGGTADAPALGAGVARRASSNLASPTTEHSRSSLGHRLHPS